MIYIIRLNGKIIDFKNIKLEEKKVILFNIK